MTKYELRCKWEKAENATAEQVKDRFTRKELVEFWNDVKDVAWPEFYGDSPWEAACEIAYIVAGNTVTNSYILDSKEYAIAMEFMKGVSHG